MRETLSNCLVNLGRSDKNSCLLTGDHGYALFDRFRKECPEQFINAGVAEQNMIGVAAGLAKTGFFPVIYGLSAFVPVRVLEQIKVDFCYENLPCLILGDGAGVVYSALGASHQSTEDIACLRAIPNMTILAPADSYELEECFSLALKLKSPVYLRLGKADLGKVHQEKPVIKIGELTPVKVANHKVAIFANGSLLSVASELIKSKNLAADLWSVPCIKPLKKEKILQVTDQYKKVIVLEEHSSFGGVGSAIAEIAAEVAKTQIHCMGTQDKFSEFCGSYKYLMKENQLDIESLGRRIDAILV